MFNLLSSTIIQFITEYYSSNQHRLTLELAYSIFHGLTQSFFKSLTLNYQSVFIPILCFTVTFYRCIPKSDNPEGIFEISILLSFINDHSNIFYFICHTTAPISKRFIIDLAALVGAFKTLFREKPVDILQLTVLSGYLVGLITSNSSLFF